MVKDKYERMLKQFELYYPDFYEQTVDWWASGRTSIGLKLKNGERIDYNSYENNIRWLKSDESIDDEYRRKAFGSNLQKIIPFCGMTKSEIAEKIGVTNAMFSRYLHGTTMPSVDKAYLIAKLVGCTVEELFDDNFIE